MAWVRASTKTVDKVLVFYTDSSEENGNEAKVPENVTGICQAHLWQPLKTFFFFLTLCSPPCCLWNCLVNARVRGIHSFSTPSAAPFTLCSSISYPSPCSLKMETLMPRTLSNFHRFLWNWKDFQTGDLILNSKWNMNNIRMKAILWWEVSSPESTDLLHFPLALCFFILSAFPNQPWLSCCYCFWISIQMIRRKSLK